VTGAVLATAGTIHDGTRHREKDREKAEAFAAVCRHPGATRTDLASRLGVRPSSVGELVRELVEDGLVVEQASRRGGRTGRPRAPLAARPDRVVGVSLAVESRVLRGALVDLAGRPLAEAEQPLGPGADNRAIGQALSDLVLGLADRRSDGSLLAGAAISLVGTVSPADLTWVNAARWPRLRDLPLAPLARRLRAPLLLRRSPDTALALRLDARPAGRNRTQVLLHWGFGVGAAVSYRGTILGSSIGRFGEIGHVPVTGRPGRGARCLCGSRGCLETAAALWALLPRLRRRLGALPENEGELAAILAGPAVAGFPEVRAAVDAIGAALVVLHRVFYPEEILLAGPLAGNPAVLDALRDGFRAGLPDYARQATALTVLEGGLAACRTGSAGPLLERSLRPMLRRRT
jgi:predicted NBD/HSP70 family sugar kinase